MAKIVSPVWSSIRGSIAGTTYLTTSSGQIIARQRTRPVNTPSNYRTYIWDAMITRAAQWNAITGIQRGDWETWAIANGFHSGRQAFIAGTGFMQFVTNTGLAGAVTGLFDSRPETNNSPSCTILPTAPVIAGTDAVAVKVQNNGPQRVMCYYDLSPGMSPARTFWKGPWDTSKSKANTIASGITTITEFSGLQLGARYFIRVRACLDDVTVGLRGNRCQKQLQTTSIAVHVP